MRGQPSWAGVWALGLVTITSYGSWFYGFGVLIEPIEADQGWSTTILGLTYGAAQVVAGVGAFIGGRLLDRHGGKGPFLTQAVAGGGLLLAATWAESAPMFSLLYGLGGGIIGATGFYHVTTAAAARLRPREPDRAIAVLTVIGALCSPVYLPLTAWLVSTWDWRVAARVLALLAIAGALVAVAVAAGGASDTPTGPSARAFGAMKQALGRPSTRRMLAVYFAAGMAYASVLVYQVPILTAAGLSLGAAGAIAGLRGFCQIFGRVGLTGTVDRFGARAMLRFAYAASAVGVSFLFLGKGLMNTTVAGLAYAVIAGAALGATSPLQAMYARTEFDAGDLGLLMGLQGAAVGLSGGLGPLLGGVLHDLTNSWSPAVLLSIITLCVASWLLRSVRQATVRAA